MDFVADGLVIVSANEPIQSSDYTSGLARRRITIPFKVQPRQERRLIEFQEARPVGEFAEYLPGLANWALALTDAEVTDILKNATLESPTMYAAKMENLLATNPIAAWANDLLIKTDNPEEIVKVGLLKPSDNGMGYANTRVWLYPAYCEYTKQSGHKPVAASRFTSLLEDLLFSQLKLEGISRPPRDRKYGSHFKGLALRPESDITTPLFITEREMPQPPGSTPPPDGPREGESDPREGGVSAQVIECDEREGSEGFSEVAVYLYVNSGSNPPCVSDTLSKANDKSAKTLHTQESSSQSNTSAFTPPSRLLHAFTDDPTFAFTDDQAPLVIGSNRTCIKCGGRAFTYGVTTMTCNTCGYVDFEDI